MKDIVNFLFEIGILSKTPRSFFSLLGHGSQSVSEHINRVTFIGYTLAMLEKDIDITKIIKMCLFHDIAESRVSDLNYVHQKYVNTSEEKATQEITQNLPFGDDIRAIIKEYEERKTKEAIIAKDADNLEFLLSLEEESDMGNTRARTWMQNVIKRLKTESAIKIAEEMLTSKSDDWWYSDKSSEWWVNRNKREN